MAKGKGVGQGFGQKDGTRVKGQWGGVGQGFGQKDGTRVKGAMGWGGVGPWVKGGKGLGHGGDSDITRNIHRGIL